MKNKMAVFLLCFYQFLHFSESGTNFKLLQNSSKLHTSSKPLNSTLAIFASVVGNTKDNYNGTAHKRVKRQAAGSGAGKFTDAAQMPQTKTLRLFLQFLKNTWAPTYVGGTHPLHHNVPKAIILLVKQKIIQFFFPPVGMDAIKD